MPATMITIGTLAPDGQIHLQRYAEIVIPLLQAAGVTIRGRYRGVETLVGPDYPDLIAIMDFPSVAAMKAFLTSDSYATALPHRHKAFMEIRTFASELIA